MEYKVISPRQDNITLLEQILYNRGFSNQEEIQHYLNVDEKDLLDPLLLDHMRDGVKMLVKHIKLSSEIAIIVD